MEDELKFILSDTYHKLKMAVCSENYVISSKFTLLRAPKAKLLRGTCTAGTGHSWKSGSLGLVKSSGVEEQEVSALMQSGHLRKI